MWPISLVLVIVAAAMPGGCQTLLGRPVSGDVVRPFAPVGRYGGHWGVDLAAPIGTPVRASAGGTVTFAGSVAGVRSVTVHHGGGLRTSYSYLSAIDVRSQQVVRSGRVLGESGLDHGRAALHWSLRSGDEYRDPLAATGCGYRPFLVRLAGALPPALAYSSARAARHSRRNIRPTSHRPPRSRRSGIPRPRSRPGDLHSRRFSMAKGGARPVPGGASASDDPARRARHRLLRGRRP